MANFAEGQSLLEVTEQSRHQLVRKCDEYFEQALFNPESSGRRTTDSSTIEYVALVNDAEDDSVFIYRNDAGHEMAQTYPYFAAEEVDARVANTGEPVSVELNYPIDIYGRIHMCLQKEGRLMMVDAPKSTAQRIWNLIQRGSLAELV